MKIDDLLNFGQKNRPVKVKLKYNNTTGWYESDRLKIRNKESSMITIHGSIPNDCKLILEESDNAGAFGERRIEEQDLDRPIELQFTEGSLQFKASKGGVELELGF